MNWNGNKMTKMQSYMRSIKITCSKHSEFKTSCSDCWITLQKYGIKNNIDKELIHIINYASKLDKIEWKPFMNIGYFMKHGRGHCSRWSKELYEERKKKYDEYYKIKRN